MHVLRVAAGLAIAGVAAAAWPAARQPATKSTDGPATTQATVKRTADAGSMVATPISNGIVAPDISERVIHRAVKDSIDPRDDPPSAPGTFGGGPVDRQARIDRAFAAAEIPSCLTMDAWKLAPPMIGPIPIPGFFAAPLLLRNIVTGKCRH